MFVSQSPAPKPISAWINPASPQRSTNCLKHCKILQSTGPHSVEWRLSKTFMTLMTLTRTRKILIDILDINWYKSLQTLKPLIIYCLYQPYPKKSLYYSQPIKGIQTNKKKQKESTKQIKTKRNTKNTPDLYLIQKHPTRSLFNFLTSIHLPLGLPTGCFVLEASPFFLSKKAFAYWYSTNTPKQFQNTKS